MITNLTDRQKINWIRIIAIIPVLILMLYAPKLWVSTKNFPTVPLYNWLPVLQYPLDYILAVGFFLIQVIYIFKNKTWLGWTIILFYIFLALIDQNRLQPYFYQSFLTILAIEIFNKNTNPKKILYVIILIFFATYFWSGIQKINADFYVIWLRALNKHFSFLPQWFLVGFTYAVPWLEAIMGVLLLFNKTRKFGVLFILLMHSIITFLLFYLGYGYNVVPWNFQNILSVIILFWTLKTSSPFDFFLKYFNKQKLIMLTFTIIFPFANSINGFYDNLLSFHFFTADLKYYYIEINDELKEKLPKYMNEYYRKNDNTTIVFCNEWAAKVNKVLFYPEDRVIEYTDNFLRSFAKNPNKEGLTKVVHYNKIEK
ncbi:MauE/DoxX family redox-associated membrane protein [Polaribacter sp. Asnod1-A03]|uniref:MauE/DoxX family redox-associated membrane protein n=1 Tax=Polaribacter sp. Asnod1-A03 TaxID=3160581 RepID=UPI003866BE59